MKDARLVLVDSWEEAELFIDWLGQRHEYLAVDTESKGLKWWLPDQLRMIQFGDTETGWAVPLHRWGGLAERALERFDGGWVMHNMPFDLHQLQEAGLPVPGRAQCHDTKILHHISDPLASHGLKRIATRKWGAEAAIGEKELKRAFKQNKWFWDTVPYDFPAYWCYSAMDTVLTARLFADLRGGAAGDAYRRELDVARICWAAEKRGLRIDDEYTQQLAGKWLQDMLQIQERLDTWGLHNPNSRVQLLAALQAEIDFEPGEWTPTGQPKLSEGILADLSGEVASDVLRYRRLRKWSAAYLEHFLHEQDPLGRVHPSINTMAARTGRMSVTGPPLQTLPRGTEIRDCILPYPGEKLLLIDFDIMELRCGAAFCGDPMMSLAFKEGKDLHRFAASLALGIPEDEVDKKTRQAFKTVGYAKFYCAGMGRIAQTMRQEMHDSSLTDDQAAHLTEQWSAAFEGVDPFIKSILSLGESRSKALGYGYVNTTGGRQVRCLPGEEYKLVNGLIQGSCRDVFGEVMTRVDNAGYGDCIVLPVHDELIFSLRPEDFEDARHELTELMTWNEFPVPLTVSASPALDRWGDEYREE